MAPGSPAPRWPLSPPSHPTPPTGAVAEQKPPKPGKCPPLERGMLLWPSRGSWGGPWWPCRGPLQEGAWGGLVLLAASRRFHASGARIWRSPGAGGAAPSHPGMAPGWGAAGRGGVTPVGDGALRPAAHPARPRVAPLSVNSCCSRSTRKGCIQGGRKGIVSEHKFPILGSDAHQTLPQPSRGFGVVPYRESGETPWKFGALVPPKSHKKAHGNGAHGSIPAATTATGGLLLPPLHAETPTPRCSPGGTRPMARTPPAHTGT